MTLDFTVKHDTEARFGSDGEIFVGVSICFVSVSGHGEFSGHVIGQARGVIHSLDLVRNPHLLGRPDVVHISRVGNVIHVGEAVPVDVGFVIGRKNYLNILILWVKILNHYYFKLSAPGTFRP